MAPAITNTSSPTAALTAPHIDAFSSLDKVGDSPVVPVTTSPSDPLLINILANSAHAPKSTSPDAVIGVTIAVINLALLFIIFLIL